ncbi:hypothetical protein M422DRAFT_23026 [Sphaerobolus stellatus SS14]|nr:hypothetical protein M422DRAFT_23026 [Sphaerobolus stellatus SS14]
MLTILLLFPLSTMLVIGSLYSLPIEASFPKTVADMAELARELQAYSESGLRPRLHVMGVLSATALWKHAWSVPGSVLLNVLCGVLLPPIVATMLMTSLTAVGSILSSLLATPLAPIISQWFPKALNLTRSALEGSSPVTASEEKSPVWVRLSVLRLIGVVPWSGINIACGVAGVALFDCLLGAFIGTLPWTAVTCQIGDILQTFAQTKAPSSSETITSLLRSPNVIFKLVILSVISLVPILVRDRLKGLVSRSESADMEEATVTEVKDASGKRWWFRHWRTRSREGVEVVALDRFSEKLAAAS